MTNKPASSARNFKNADTGKSVSNIANKAIMDSFSLALRGAGRKDSTDATYRRALQRLAAFANEKGMH